MGAGPSPAWIWERRVEPNAGLRQMFYMEHFARLRCRVFCMEHMPIIRLGVLRRTIGLYMFCTTQLYFSRIVLEPGVNIKIFSGCAHKKDIYKFHTMGA